MQRDVLSGWVQREGSKGRNFIQIRVMKWPNNRIKQALKLMKIHDDTDGIQFD